MRSELTFFGKPIRAVAGRKRHGKKKGFRTYCEIGRLGFGSVDYAQLFVDRAFMSTVIIYQFLYGLKISRSTD